MTQPNEPSPSRVCHEEDPALHSTSLHPNPTVVTDQSKIEADGVLINQGEHDTPSPRGSAIDPDHHLPGEDQADQALNLKKNAKRSVVYMLSGKFGSELLRLTSNLVLTRLLAPDVYGLMVLVNVVLTGLKMFSDIGIGPSIVQSKRTDPTFLNTAWTIQVIRGFVLMGIACGLAWPAAWFYDEPWLKLLLPVAAISAVISGFNSTSIFNQHRAVRMDKLVVLQFTVQAIMVSSMIGWAVFISRDVWALVIGGLVSSMIYMIFSHVWLKGEPVRLCFDRQAFRELNRFGIWVLLGTICTFVATQADRAVFGHLLTTEQLGLYGIALFLSTGLANVVQLLSRQVLFPVLAETARSQPELMLSRLVKARRKFNLLAMPTTGLLFGAGPVIVALLYDDRYLGAGWMLQVLAVYGATTCLIMPGTNALMALGLPKNNFQVNLSRAIWMAIAIPVGWHVGSHYGNPTAGALWAVGLSGLTGYAVVCWGLIKQGMFRLRFDAEGIAMFLGGGLVGALIQMGVKTLGWTS